VLGEVQDVQSQDNADGPDHGHDAVAAQQYPAQRPFAAGAERLRQHVIGMPGVPERMRAKLLMRLLARGESSAAERRGWKLISSLFSEQRAAWELQDVYVCRRFLEA
jgi:hypothetical protein